MSEEMKNSEVKKTAPVAHEAAHTHTNVDTSAHAKKTAAPAKAEAKPAKTETILPAIKGSENNFKNGIVVHIKRGCLPSERGRKRKVDSARITCDQRI